MESLPPESVDKAGNRKLPKGIWSPFAAEQAKPPRPTPLSPLQFLEMTQKFLRLGGNVKSSSDLDDNSSSLESVRLNTSHNRHHHHHHHRTTPSKDSPESCEEHLRVGLSLSPPNSILRRHHNHNGMDCKSSAESEIEESKSLDSLQLPARSGTPELQGSLLIGAVGGRDGYLRSHHPHKHIPHHPPIERKGSSEADLEPSRHRDSHTSHRHTSHHSHHHSNDGVHTYRRNSSGLTDGTESECTDQYHSAPLKKLSSNNDRTSNGSRSSSNGGKCRHVRFSLPAPLSEPFLSNAATKKSSSSSYSGSSTHRVQSHKKKDKAKSDPIIPVDHESDLEGEDHGINSPHYAHLWQALDIEADD